MISWYYLLAIGIILVGIFIFFIQLYTSRRLKKINVPEKPKAIEHYEKIRDKLTTREVEEKIEEEHGLPSILGNLPSLIMGMVTISIILAVSLVAINSLQTTVNEMPTTNNTDLINVIPSQMAELTSFFPIVIIIAMIGIVIGVVTRFGGGSDPEFW